MKDVLCIRAELAFKFPLLGRGDGGMGGGGKRFQIWKLLYVL